MAWFANWVARPFRRVTEGWSAAEFLRTLSADALSGGRPELAQVVAVTQEPIEADQGVTAFDGTGIEQDLDLRQGLDDDANVFVLFGQPVHPRGGGRVDAATE